MSQLEFDFAMTTAFDAAPAAVAATPDAIIATSAAVSLVAATGSTNPRFVSTEYLAQRVGTHISCVNGAAERAMKRGAEASEFRPTKIKTAGNRDVPGFLVGAPGIDSLAEGMTMAGQHGKAAIYREVADEMRRSEVQSLPTIVRHDGAEVLAANRSSVANDARKKARRKAKAGTLPEVRRQRGTGRPAFEQIEAALFIGCGSPKLRRSVAKLIASSPEVLGQHVFETEIIRVNGRKLTAQQKIDSTALTAEALDMLAEQFDACTNATGRSRAGNVRALAEHLREIGWTSTTVAIAAE